MNEYILNVGPNIDEQKQVTKIGNNNQQTK